VRSVLVVGGGLAGITSAFECQRRGLRTVLIDAEDSVGQGASHANGALLTPSMSDPWNAPGVHRHLAASLFDPAAAMKLRLRAVPGLANWGLRFLRNSTQSRFRANTRASYVLARYSVERTCALRQYLGLRYDASDIGTMKLFRSAEAMDRPLAIAHDLADLGLRFERLDREQAIAEEPALAPIADRIHGALRFRADEVGDAYLFCRALADAFTGSGGEVRVSAPVKRVIVRGGRAIGVELVSGEKLTADATVLAAGVATPRLGRSAGLNLPIAPAKGYTLTFELGDLPGPRVAVLDDALHAGAVPLGSRLRMAGTAEFTGLDTSVNPRRVETLRRLLAELYPRISDALAGQSGEGWSGLRPMSADGLPFIGATRAPGLFVNAGHGHLGWTLAVGSAELLADAITGKTAQIDPEPYSAGR
jgi:D-amino-acid dehydrogenase